MSDERVEWWQVAGGMISYRIDHFVARQVEVLYQENPMDLGAVSEHDQVFEPKWLVWRESTDMLSGLTHWMFDGYWDDVPDAAGFASYDAARNHVRTVLYQFTDSLLQIVAQANHAYENLDGSTHVCTPQPPIAKIGDFDIAAPVRTIREETQTNT